ncbi:MAG: two-component regulator propeller domain-containing protein, partial [Bacteroidota bacterium]
MLILVCCQSPAQDHNFDRLSLEDGLSQSTVIDLVQDKKGFLWIGTMDGLNCFDGYGFKVFKNEPFDSTSLSVNFISTLMVDADGGLWVGTRGGGLHYYLSGKEEFIRCKLETNNTSSISNNFISYIHQTAKGDIWVGTANGLNKVKLNKKDQDVQITFERFLHNPERIRGESQSEHYIRALHSDKQNRLWVGTAVNLLRFDKELHADTVPTISFNFDPEDKNSLSGKSVTCIEEDGQGNLWIGTYSGLNLFLGDEKGFQRFYGEKVSGQLPSSEIFDMAKQADGTLVITTFEGISQLSINENKPQEPFYTFSDISIPGYNMSISRLTMQDRLNENILWIGTAEAGLLKVNRKPKQFYSNDLAGANPVGLKTPSIFGICKDDDGRIWMSSQNGLLEFERATNQFVLHDYNREKENELAGKYVSSMMVDSKGNLWAGTYYGLFRLDEYKKERPKFKSYIDQFHGKDRGVLCLYEDKNDNIYFGSFTGINYYDPVGDSVLNYPVILDTISAAKSDYSVRGFLSDRNDNLWVATSIGLILLENIKDPVTDIPNAITQVFFHDESDKTSLRSDYITSLMEDNKGRIWAGTYNGLIEVKKSETDISFKSYTEQDGLSNNLVYGILKDEATGYLWLSTNMGLSRFDPDTKQFDRYLAEDGLQSSEFNSAAFSKANDGEMLFGGVNGFTSFFPSNITSESSLPPVWLRSLTTLDGTHFNLLEDNQHIQLPYRQNSFAVDFVGLNYAYPDRVQYAYSIDNQDDTWISIGNARRVDFTRLAPGRYTLKVKASNHDGLWNESFAASNIEIKGPFWKTGWFFGLIIMGFGLMAF